MVLLWYITVRRLNIAIISNNDKYDNVSELNLDEVDYYNRKIINASQMQVYCSSATALNRYY